MEAGTASPDILGSPTRRMWGQCWSVLIKKGFVTPRTTFGLEREKKGGKEARRGGGRGGAGKGRGGAGRGGAEDGAYGACVRVVNSLNSLSWMVK